jgi:hypothetical protein
VSWTAVTRKARAHCPASTSRASARASLLGRQFRDRELIPRRRADQGAEERSLISKSSETDRVRLSPNPAKLRTASNSERGSSVITPMPHTRLSFHLNPEASPRFLDILNAQELEHGVNHT